MGPEALAQVLRPLADMFLPEDHPNVLRGLAAPDDAAVYRLDVSRALVLTSDFFAPVVDDPRDFGAIAAANALSDVYAMGGEPLVAINLVGFPDDLDPEILARILRGGAEKVREAGAALAGGHTVHDKEPKYGLAVVGMVHPDRILANGGARPGDALFLTKPLGTGVLTTAQKRDKVDPGHLAEAVQTMARLHRGATAILRDYHGAIHAATDVTGFGLVGHGHEMAAQSGLGLSFAWNSLPFLPGAREYAADGLVPGGGKRNRKYYARWTEIRRSLAESSEFLLSDPQTSGGLLFAVDPGAVNEVERAFSGAGQPAWRIGEAVEAPAGTIRVV
jgi:selenide,water dikinase